MKKLSFKNFSLLGLILMGASAITAAIVPSNEKSPNALADNNGTAIDSSGGGNTETVIFRQGGARSWTVTDLNPADNPLLDGVSATSNIGSPDGTLTAEMDNPTAASTSAV